MWNRKRNDTNELRKQRDKLIELTTAPDGGVGVIVKESGMDMDTLL